MFEKEGEIIFIDSFRLILVQNNFTSKSMRNTTQSGFRNMNFQGTMVSKFRSSGQTCVSPNRFYVHSSVYDSFVEEVKYAMTKLVTGDGMQPNVTQGPLINEKAIKKVI